MASHTSYAMTRVPPRADPEPEPPVPMVGESDVLLRLPVALQVRLAAESLLTGRPADAIVADALENHLRRDHRQA